MAPEEREKIRMHELCLVKDIIPTDLLPWLPCLTGEDKEVILAEERQYGPTKAARVFLDRLRRRCNSFAQLVQALRENKLQHLALILDPD